jgi:hypothetical protein
MMTPIEPVARQADRRPKAGSAVPPAKQEVTIRDLPRRVLVHLQSHDGIYRLWDRMSKDQSRSVVSGLAATSGEGASDGVVAVAGTPIG